MTYILKPNVPRISDKNKHTRDKIIAFSNLQILCVLTYVKISFIIKSSHFLKMGGLDYKTYFYICQHPQNFVEEESALRYQKQEHSM